MVNTAIVDNVNDMYVTMCKDLVTYGSKVNDTLELNNYMITVRDVSQCVINVRNVSLNYMAAELLWYLSGRNDVEFISRYASLWKRISDDGKTNNSAYGYILKKKHGFDQIEKMVELLKKDPYSRRAVMNINVPNENVIETKDEMCTICLNFQLRDNKLNCSVLMRSNDIFTGTVYDVTYFIFLQKYIADKLNVSCGTYTHIAFSLHAYDRHIENIKNIAFNTTYDDRLVNIDFEHIFNKFDAAMTDVENNKMSPEEAFNYYDIFKDVKL